MAMRDRQDARSFLPDIDVPTLVIAGKEDDVVPAAESEEMAAAIPNAHYTTVPDSGHLCPVEQPLATRRVIWEFLEALD
jgi:pimeloyl-ACP methyl ester carboxylesterase